VQQPVGVEQLVLQLAVRAEAAVGRVVAAGVVQLAVAVPGDIADRPVGVATDAAGEAHRNLRLVLDVDRVDHTEGE
jgi:hypothetical protein